MASQCYYSPTKQLKMEAVLFNMIKIKKTKLPIIIVLLIIVSLIIFSLLNLKNIETHESKIVIPKSQSLNKDYLFGTKENNKLCNLDKEYEICFYSPENTVSILFLNKGSVIYTLDTKINDVNFLSATLNKNIGVVALPSDKLKDQYEVKIFNFNSKKITQTEDKINLEINTDKVLNENLTGIQFQWTPDNNYLFIKPRNWYFFDDKKIIITKVEDSTLKYYKSYISEYGVNLLNWEDKYNGFLLEVLTKVKNREGTDGFYITDSYKAIINTEAEVRKIMNLL